MYKQKQTKRDKTMATTNTTALTHTFELAGDGEYGAEAGRKVTITSVEVTRYDAVDAEDMGVTDGDVSYISVHHDSTWDVYTDSAFVAAVEFVTGIDDLDFTEQGEQEDNCATLEVL